MPQDNAIVQLDRAKLALAECKTAMEAKQIADVAEAARIYLARTNASVETVNHATEIRLLAERQMGAFLKTMPKNEGAKGKRTSLYVSATARDQVKDGNPTLKEIGISYHEAHVSQKLADIPEPEFQERIAAAKARGGKLSTAAVLPPTRRMANVFDLAAWKKQTRSVMTSWLRDMPERHQAEAAAFLAELPQKIITHLS